MSEDMVRIMTDGSMRAAANAIGKFPRTNALTLAEQATRLCAALKEELTARWEEFAAEWKDAVEAHMPKPMLAAILNTQCRLVAVKALKRVETELEGGNTDAGGQSVQVHEEDHTDPLFAG